jgi:transcription factor 1
MSFPLLLRRSLSTSTRCSYRTKNIPEDIVAKTITTQARRRGSSKDIQNTEDIKLEAEPQSSPAPKAARKPRTRKTNKTLPVDRFNLPPRSTWRNYFPTSGMALKSRISIANPETAALVANSFVPSGSRDKVIVEAYPGEGTDI